MTVHWASLQSFHDIAYFAEDRQDLLNGMNEFLDCSIVIPPSDVAGKDLLKTVVDFQKQLLAKKKERDLQRQSSLGLEDHRGAPSKPEFASVSLFCSTRPLDGAKALFSPRPSSVPLVALLDSTALNPAVVFCFCHTWDRIPVD